MLYIYIYNYIHLYLYIQIYIPYSHIVIIYIYIYICIYRDGIYLKKKTSNPIKRTGQAPSTAAPWSRSPTPPWSAASTARRRCSASPRRLRRRPRKRWKRPGEPRRAEQNATEFRVFFGFFWGGSFDSSKIRWNKYMKNMGWYLGFSFLWWDTHGIILKGFNHD